MSIAMPMPSPLDRARKKAYFRLLPLLFLCYVIAYVDRANVAIAKLTMSRDLPQFDNAVIGFGAGVFFIGYFLLEIPGTLIVERWSARKWISRIMVSWGIVAALTAFVKEPWHFYTVRFFQLNIEISLNSLPNKIITFSSKNILATEHVSWISIFPGTIP